MIWKKKHHIGHKFAGGMQIPDEEEWLLHEATASIKQKVTKNVLGHEELHQCLDDGWYSIDGFWDTNICQIKPTCGHLR